MQWRLPGDMLLPAHTHTHTYTKHTLMYTHPRTQKHINRFIYIYLERESKLQVYEQGSFAGHTHIHTVTPTHTHLHHLQIHRGQREDDEILEHIANKRFP